MAYTKINTRSPYFVSQSGVANDSILVEEHRVVKAFLSHMFTRAKRSKSGHRYVSRKIGDNQWRIWRVK